MEIRPSLQYRRGAAGVQQEETKDSFRGLHTVWDCWEEESRAGGTILDAVQLDTEVLYTGSCMMSAVGKKGGGGGNNI